MSVEFGIITSVMPPRGWHYPQVLSSGQTHRIEGFSFEQLLGNMLDFRTRHSELCGGNQNATVEAVRRDLKAYLCAHFPSNCADSKKAPQSAIGIGITHPEYHKPIDRATDWLAEAAHHRVDLVDIGLAGQRAQICVGCPQNIRWKSSCAPCNNNAEVRIQHVKGNLRTPYDSHLFMCRVYGWVNEVAIWMRDGRGSAIHPAPANCWKVQEHAETTAS